MFRLIAIATTCLAASLSAIPAAAAPAKAPKGDAPAALPSRQGHFAVNGVDYYYEVRGQGEPLLLLHGGLGSIDMFAPVMGRLAAHRQVIAVDLQGHGRTALGERAFSLEAMGDDMAEIARRLGHPQLDVMGYSLGGGVALRMAIQKPASVRRLVLVSTGFSEEGFYPAIRAMQTTLSGAAAPMMKDTPMYRTYARLAPKPEDFPRLLDTMGNLMRQHYDWSQEAARLTMPVMLVYGDADMYQPEHEIRFYQLLGGGKQDAGWGRETMARNRLAILPDLTHYDIFTSPRLAETALPFLNGKSDAAAWSGAGR
jgi:pimeloyl-ACP methyl ester carboxylesterase